MAFRWHRQFAYFHLNTKAIINQRLEQIKKLAVEQTILNEIAEGNYVISDAKPTIISALGTIP